jgi:predicted metal-dependent RNase
MINQTEIDRIQAAHDKGDIEGLIKALKAELRARELMRGDTCEIKPLNSDKSVVAKIIGEHYGLHKTMGTTWNLTHIKTGVPVLIGKKARIMAIIDDFIAWDVKEKLYQAIEEHKLNALNHITPEQTSEYRDFYNAAKYGE